MQFDSIVKIFNDTRLIFATTLVLAVVLAYQISLVVWMLIPQPETTSVTSVQRSSVSQSTPKKLSTRQKIQQISQSHLFGQAIKESVAVTTVQEAPDSSLNYKLRGIYYSDDESLASVILQKNANKTNFYRLGDEIDNQIFINQIQQDHILISRRGRLEKLSLEKPLANIKNQSKFSKAKTRANPDQSKVLQSYKRRYANNPLALAKRFQAIPVQQNGKNIGYKLKALRGETILRKMNLQKDDVFVAINDIGLDKPFQALDALKSLTTAENISLTVIRNGNRQTMDFSLK